VCAALASDERSLAGLLHQAALLPDGVDVCAEVMAALPAVRRRRRLLALAPVAAALAIAVLGVALVGGVPGGGLVALLPAWSAQSWAALGAVAADWAVAMVVAARAAGVLVPTTVAVAALALAFLGCVGTVAIAVRWRRRRAWQRSR
jgi:hypothetical protein